MSASRFVAHLNEQDSRFLCYPAGQYSANRIEVPIEHAAGGHAAPDHLAKLRRLLGTHAAWGQVAGPAGGNPRRPARGGDCRGGGARALIVLQQV